MKITIDLDLHTHRVVPGKKHWFSRVHFVTDIRRERERGERERERDG